MYLNNIQILNGSHFSCYTNHAHNVFNTMEKKNLRLGMPSKKKSPYGGTLSQPHITPSPPSKVGTKIEGTFFGF